MKTILITIIALLASTSLFAVEAQNTKKNKINSGNIKINVPVEASALDIGGDLDVGGSVNVGGEIRLISNSGHVSLVPASGTSSTTYILPATDGTNGQFLTTNGSGILSWTTPHRADCPQGFTLIGSPDTAEAFCISSTQETTSTWLKAITNCYNKPTKAHLCTASEWAMSCVAEKIKNMTGHWEWVSDSGSNYGRIIGLSGCDSFNGATVDANYSSRCCFR